MSEQDQGTVEQTEAETPEPGEDTGDNTETLESAQNFDDDAVMGTVAEADTSHVDGIISDVAEEHAQEQEQVSVADQEVETVE